MTEKRPAQRPPDRYGVGMMADGKLNIVSPEEHARRVALRDAEEAQDDDLSDLGEIEKLGKPSQKR